MKIIINTSLLFLLTCLISNFSHSNQSEITKFYNNGKFDDALKLLLKQPNSAGKFFNIGNVYYKKGDLGKSIGFWEKAKTYSPRDKDIRHNLNLAMSKVSTKKKFLNSLHQMFFSLILMKK